MSTEQLNLTGFTKIDIKGAFRFAVAKADTYSVSIERYWYHPTQVYQRDDVLVVYHPWYDVLGWFTPWVTPAVKVAMPELRELSVSGACVGSAKGFSSTQDFKLRVRGASRLTAEINAGNSEFEVAGASRIELAAVVKELKFKVAGASRITGSLTADKGEIRVAGASRIGLKGTIGDAVIDVAGASRLDLGDLTARVVGIRIVGASQLAVNVQDKMDAELAGASRLVYGGNPIMGNIRMVGASTMSRK